MIEYIYFVKCPNCDDEPFGFFDEAKEFALGCLSKKPIITQTEVNRNDFGECIDSADLGTVWSWEELMTDVPDDSETVFKKEDTFEVNLEQDPEFDSLDNVLDSVPDNFLKPVPADMTVDALVEAMEENEDTVECKWCHELFDKSECRYEVDLGYLCDQCVAAIKSRGETLTFKESTLSNRTWICEFDGKEIGTVEAASEEEAYTKMEQKYPEYPYGQYDGVALVYLEDDFLEEDIKKETVDLEYDDLDKIQSLLLDLQSYLNELAVSEQTLSETEEDDIYQDILNRINEHGFSSELTAKFIDILNVDLSLFDSILNLVDYLNNLISNDSSLDEAFDSKEQVELEYDRLTTTVTGPRRDVDDWDEVEYSDSYTYGRSKEDVATAIWENFITEEDVTDIPGGLEALEDDTAWNAFLETHFDTLFEKYYEKLLDYYRDDAIEAFRESSSYDDYIAEQEAERADREYDVWRDEQFNENLDWHTYKITYSLKNNPDKEHTTTFKTWQSDVEYAWRKSASNIPYSTVKNIELIEELADKKPDSVLEELEDADTYKKRLTMCPECGADAYDLDTGFCINCGFNTL